MARFCDLGVESDVIVGKGIEMNELFGKRIVIEKVKIEPTKYPGKNASGLRMQMQIVLAEFNETPDEDDDYFVKGPDGTPKGERRSCFTGSDLLIESIQKAEQQLPSVNEQRAKAGLKLLRVFPMDTTIDKIGKCFQFR